MKKLIIATILFVLSFEGFGQGQPSGYPITSSSGWIKYGYLQNDSGRIDAKRDTLWTPSKVPTTVYWQHAGVDTAWWTFNGKTSGQKWDKGVFNSSGGSGTSGWGLTGNAGTNPATNFLGTTDAKPLTFATNGIVRGIINSGTGNVGIGTTTPFSILHIEGSDPIVTIKNTDGVGQGGRIEFKDNADSIQLTITGSYGSDNTIEGDGALILKTHASSAIHFDTYNNRRMTVAANGEIGIGTPTPDSLLTVESGIWGKRGFRLSGIPSGVGTKALRINPSTGIVTYADTTAGGGVNIYNSDGTLSGDRNIEGDGKYLKLKNLKNLYVTTSNGTDPYFQVGNNGGVDWATEMIVAPSLYSDGIYYYGDTTNNSLLFKLIAPNAGSDIFTLSNSRTADSRFLQVNNDGDDIVSMQPAKIYFTNPSNTQKVGINTSTPSTALHVIGAIKATDSISFTGLLPMSASTDSVVVRDTNGKLGTTAKSAFAGSASLTSSYIGVGNGSNLLSGNSDFIKGAYVVELNQSSGGQQVGFRATNTSASSGNTNASLFVDNGTSAGQLFKAGTNYSAYKNISAHDLGFYNNSVAGNISVLNDYGNINFAAEGGSTATMTIKNGKVGIGTTSPDSALTVNTSARVGTNLKVGTSTTSPLLIGGTGTTSALTLKTTTGVGAGGSDMIFQVGNNGATEAMRILSGGNVGINIAAPTSTLHANGSVSFKANVIADADYSVTNTDYMISCKNFTSDHTITLPSAASFSGRILVIVPPDAAGGYRALLTENIYDAGQATQSQITSTQGGVVTIQSDGTNWQVITQTTTF